MVTAGGGGPAGMNGGNVTEVKFIPTEFGLKQNFPNPFNPTTTIAYDIPYESNATLAIYNTLAQEVATLVNERQSAGRYHITWNAANIASGMYFYRLSAFDKSNKPLVFMKKLVVVK